MALRITNEGTTVTLTATSQQVTIPDNDTGTPAHYVWVATTTSAHVLPGPVGTTATTAGLLVTNEAPVILHVGGQEVVAVLQAETGGSLNVSPLEIR